MQEAVIDVCSNRTAYVDEIAVGFDNDGSYP